MNLEVMFAVIVLFSMIISEIVEFIFPPILAKYGISDKEVRKSVFVVVTAALNFALLYWQDVDVIANLLEQNQNIVTIGLAAFGASGFGQFYHQFKGLIGKPETALEVLEGALAAVKEIEVQG